MSRLSIIAGLREIRVYGASALWVGEIILMLIARIRSSRMEIDRTASERTYFFTKDNPAVRDNVRFVTDKVTAFAKDCAAGKFNPALSI